MSNRILAFIIDNDKALESAFKTSQTSKDLFNQFYIFTSTEVQTSENVINIVIPEESRTSEPKKRNFINRYFKDKNFDGFLYVVENIINFNETTQNFIEKLEQTMKVLDYSVWFNTLSDRCNYVYSKYNPRMTVNIDESKYMPLNISSVLTFTSHSNTSFVAYDFSSVDDDLLRFEEQFTIPMYFIIEFLARRRNTKKENSLFYMNQYITVAEEVGAFQVILDQKEFSKEIYAKEDAIFKSMNINYNPDNNIDNVLETLYAKLNEKL